MLINSETSRLRSLLVNSGQLGFTDADERLLQTSLALAADHDVLRAPAAQAAFLTAVAIGIRSFGEIAVPAGLDIDVQTRLPISGRHSPNKSAYSARSSAPSNPANGCLSSAPARTTINTRPFVRCGTVGRRVFSRRRMLWRVDRPRACWRALRRALSGSPKPSSRSMAMLAPDAECSTFRYGRPVYTPMAILPPPSSRCRWPNGLSAWAISGKRICGVWRSCPNPIPKTCYSPCRTSTS